MDSYEAIKPSTLNADADNISISGSQYAIYSKDRAITKLNATENVNLSSSYTGIYAIDKADTQIQAVDNITVSVILPGIRLLFTFSSSLISYLDTNE